MRKGQLILMLLVVLLATPMMNAQKYGVRAGLNISNLKGSDIGAVNPRLAYYAGFYKEATLIPKILYLVPEAQYSSQGFKSVLIGGGEKEYTIDYINVPVLMKLYLLKAFSLEAGPQFGFKINDNYESLSGNDIETFDPGFAGGLGINFPFGLSFEARYTHGFKSIIKNTNARDQVFQLGAAFQF